MRSCWFEWCLSLACLCHTISHANSISFRDSEYQRAGTSSLKSRRYNCVDAKDFVDLGMGLKSMHVK